MEISYWQSRWRKNNTGWHMDEVFPLLKTYWHHLNLEPGAIVFVPLCGKSLDIDWLIQQGYYVIGNDVSPKALGAIMERLPASFTASTKGNFTCYQSESAELWCGDFFKLRKDWLPKIDAAYDKAALMTQPPDGRAEYAGQLQSLLQPFSHIFINCFEYNQQEMPGPPFAVFRDELDGLFGHSYTINLLHTHALFDTLTAFHRRGLSSYLNEKIYHLTPT